jgi:hypothetical protein
MARLLDTFENMKSLKILFILTVLLTVQAYGQRSERVIVREVERRSLTISGGMTLAVPRGEFGENYEGNPFGLYGMLSIPFRNLPLEIGGGFVWHSMSRASSPVDLVNELVPERDEGDLEVRGNSYTYQLHGRLRPFNGRFRPYGELYAGVRNFRLTSELKVEDVFQASGDLVETDVTVIAGYAIGAKFELIPGFFLEGRFDSQAGSTATYVDPTSVVIENDGSFSFDTRDSETSQWAISLGVAFSF